MFNYSPLPSLIAKAEDHTHLAMVLTRSRGVPELTHFFAVLVTPNGSAARTEVLVLELAVLQIKFTASCLKGNFASELSVASPACPNTLTHTIPNLGTRDSLI